jgi:hypothetical protein
MRKAEPPRVVVSIFARGATPLKFIRSDGKCRLAANPAAGGTFRPEALFFQRLITAGWAPAG